jgi:tetratricopeptide (TPR) repeat protein
MQRLTIVPPASLARTLDAQLRIYVLGAPRLAFGADRPPLRGRPKLWPLLALLAFHAGDLLARDRVASLLWPDAGERAARANLRRHLSYLEAALPALPDGTWLKRSSTHVGWNPGRQIWIDARAFVDAGLRDDGLRDAVGLYGGDFLSGVDDAWANAERRRLRERYLDDLERLIGIERRAGNARAAVLHSERAFVLFGEALALARETGDDIAIGKALATTSNAARRVGAYDEALTLATEAFIMFARNGDGNLCGYALVTSGCAAFSQGDLGAARSAFDAALTQYRLTDAESEIALVLGKLALCCYYGADDVAAALLAGEAAQRAEALGNPSFRAGALLTLARVARRRRDDERAHTLLRDVFALAASFDEKDLLVAAAEVALQLAIDVDPRRAAMLLGALDAARDRYVVPRGPVERPEYGELIGDLRARLGPEVYAAARRAGAQVSLDDALAGASALSAVPAPT